MGNVVTTTFKATFDNIRPLVIVTTTAVMLLGFGLVSGMALDIQPPNIVGVVVTFWGLFVAGILSRSLVP